MLHIETLVVVEEDVENAMVGITEQCLQRDPPALVKVLPFIHHDGVVANIQEVSRVHKRLRQLLVKETFVVSLRRQHVSPLGQVVTQCMEIGDVEVGRWR